MKVKRWWNRPRFIIVYDVRARRLGPSGEFEAHDSAVVHSQHPSKRAAVRHAKAEIKAGNTQLLMRVARASDGRVVWESGWDPAKIEAELREMNQ
jgi:hypothetical protein